MTLTVNDWKGILNAPLLLLSSVEPNTPSFMRYSFGILNIFLNNYFVSLTLFPLLWSIFTLEDHSEHAPVLTAKGRGFVRVL